jgi:DNA polymerase IV
VQIARTLRERVRREAGLPITVGGASTKHLAKVASAAAKPDGLLVLEPERELPFLHGLPVERIWGVGPATAERLHALGLRTVGELAATPEAELVRALGRGAGRHLHAIAHNRDPRPVRAGRRRRSVGAQHALGRRRRSEEELDAVALRLVDKVTRRLRAKGLAGRTVVLRLRFDDMTRATRSKTLPRASASTASVLAALRALLAAERATIEARGITLLGVTVTNLEPAEAQLELALAGPGPALDAAVDAVRERFGREALQRATLLDAEPERAPEL